MQVSPAMVVPRAVQVKRSLAGEPLAFAFRTLSATLRHYGHRDLCVNYKMQGERRVYDMPSNVCACWGDLWAVFRQQAHKNVFCADCETESRTGTGVHGANEDCPCSCHKRGDGVAVPMPGYWTKGLK